MVQWLRCRISSIDGTGSIPGQGSKSPRGVRPKKGKEKFESHWSEALDRARGQCSGLCCL